MHETLRGNEIRGRKVRRRRWRGETRGSGIRECLGTCNLARGDGLRGGEDCGVFEVCLWDYYWI